MTRFASWIIVAALLTAFGGVTYHVVRQRAESGKDMPEYSAYSKEDNGLAAAALFLRNAGWEPVALSRPIQHTHYRGLLILVQPQGYSFLPGQESDLSGPDARSLVRWVEQGNTLLLCGRGMDTLHEQLGVSLHHDRTAARVETVTAADLGEAGRYTDR